LHADCPSDGWVVEDASHASSEPPGIARLEEKPRLPHNFRQAADGRRYHQPAAHHVFDGRQTRCLLPYGGHHHRLDIAKRILEGGPPKEAGELHEFPQPQRGEPLL